MVITQRWEQIKTFGFDRNGKDQTKEAEKMVPKTLRKIILYGPKLSRALRSSVRGGQ